MDLDTALLRAIVQIETHGSFGRAAEHLHITQQALSKRIARAEQIFGTRLVDRSDRRRIVLTNAGRELLPAAIRILHEIDDLAVHRGGRLRVDPMMAEVTPMSWLRAAAEAGVAVLPVYRPPDQSAAQFVASGRADVAFGSITAADDPWPRHLHRRIAMLEPMNLIVGADHSWAGRDAVRLAELKDSDAWFPMAGAPREWQDLILALGREFDLQIDQEGATMGYEYWLAKVAEGNAPPSFIGAEMALPDGMCSIELVDPTPVFAWWAVWPRRTTPTALLAHTPLGAAGRLPSGLLEPARTWLAPSDRAAVATGAR
ncbi:LysR family transcriptional regulator [Blastococcus sp. Marseille-P5729]|uniref:LysR family transcriptional regulator n=1 Tax=Blastococcus sp. Marseille-P5729 TaxID=2086582 RepID=UPI00131C44BC|nr:LysR family transcriptional regulator [Blastococcus sp. Marseille-P5729]